MLSKFLLISGLIFCSLTNVASAHPVAFAGSYSLMAWNSKESTDWIFTHSFTSTYSLSAHYLRIDTVDGERKFYFPQVNFLLKRWNELDSQANIYLSLGQGIEQNKISHDNMSFAALELDWESRKYYVSFKEEALINNKNSSKNYYMTRVRGGFAPYVGDFNELNAWFILQAEKSNKSNEDYTLTPLIRLFYRNVLTEFGANQNGDAQFNFMVHF